MKPGETVRKCPKCGSLVRGMEKCQCEISKRNDDTLMSTLFEDALYESAVDSAFSSDSSWDSSSDSSSSWDGGGGDFSGGGASGDW